MTPNLPRYAARYRTRNIVFGALVVLAVVVAAVVYFGNVHVRTEHRMYAVYVPGRDAVDLGTRVTYRTRAIGSVDSVRPALAGLQLTIFPGRVPEVPEVATILAGESVTVGGHLTITLARTADRVSLATGGWSVYAERVGPGAWRLSAPAPVTGLKLDGDSVLTGRGQSVPLRAGERLSFGMAPPLELAWGDVDYLTRVVLNIDARTFREQAQAAGVRDTTLDDIIGPGSTVALSSGFGRPRPELEIQPSLLHHELAVVDPGQVRRGPRELSPAAALDPLEAVTTLGSYLASPVALRQAPSNRFETAIADVNSTLASVRELAMELNRSGQGDHPGALMRLALADSEQRNVALLLGTAPAVRQAAGELKQIAASLRFALGDTTARGRLLHQLLDTSYLSAQASLRNVESITTRLSRRDSSLLTMVAGSRVDSILSNAAHLTGELADTTGHTSPLVRIAGPNAGSLVGHVNGIAGLAHKPGAYLVDAILAVLLLHLIRHI